MVETDLLTQDARLGHSQTGRRSLPPYHLFEKKGTFFLYDLTSGRFAQIDAPAYDLLACCLNTSLPGARAQLEVQGTYAPETLDEVELGVTLLAERGLFSVPEPPSSEETLERQLDERYDTPWTKLELALAETCNLNCRYCYCEHYRDQKRNGLMTVDVARTAIDWLFAVSRGEEKLGLTLFGGEPLLNRTVFEFVMDYTERLCRERNKTVTFSMTTNGTLLSDWNIEAIKKHNFGLMVSLDGPPRIHDAQCPYHDGRGSFQDAAAGIKRLMRRRKRVTVRCTVTSPRVSRRELVEFFEQFGFTRIVIGEAAYPYTSDANWDTAALDELDRQEEEEVLPWIFEKLDIGIIPSYFPYGELIAEQANSPSAPPGLFRCGACRGTSTVGADGRIYPCHRFVGMSKFVLGRVDQGGPDIEKAKAFWREYDRAVRDTCDACWARFICNRPCPWDVAQIQGGFRPPDGARCRQMQRFVERTAWVHNRIRKDYPVLYQQLLGCPEGDNHRELDPAPVQNATRDADSDHGK